MGLDKPCKVQLEHNMKYVYANGVTTPLWIKCVSTFNASVVLWCPRHAKGESTNTVLYVYTKSRDVAVSKWLLYLTALHVTTYHSKVWQNRKTKRACYSIVKNIFPAVLLSHKNSLSSSRYSFLFLWVTAACEPRVELWPKHSLSLSKTPFLNFYT